MGIAISITQVAANTDVDKVNFRADIISFEKKASINPSGDGIMNKLPMIINKKDVKIKDIDMKIISSLLLILSTKLLLFLGVY